MLNKNYIPFLISLALFLIILFCSLVIYLKWDQPVTEEASSVEVNLPVLDWQRYSTLSKQYENGINIDN